MANDKVIDLTFFRISELLLITVITADENWRGNSKWRPLTESRFEIRYIPARIHDSNEIPTAIPMFLGSGNMEIGTSENEVRRMGSLENKDGGN